MKFHYYQVKRVKQLHHAIHEWKMGAWNIQGPPLCGKQLNPMTKTFQELPD